MTTDCKAVRSHVESGSSWDPALAKHAADCGECRPILTSHRLLTEVLGEISMPEVQLGLAKRVVRRVETSRSLSARSRWILAGYVVIFAIVSSLLISGIDVEALGGGAIVGAALTTLSLIPGLLVVIIGWPARVRHRFGL